MTGPTTPDLHQLSGAYALDALPEGERREFVRHLEDCEACAEETRELQATAARLAAAASAPVPPGLWAAVMRQIAVTRQVPPLVPHASRTDRPSRGTVASRSRWWSTPLAAVAAVLLTVAAGLGAVVAEQRSDLRQARTEAAELRQLRQDAAAIADIAADPDRVTASAPGPAGGQVTVLAADGRGVVVVEGLPALDADRTYQLWLVGAQGIEPAGLLGTDGDGVEQLTGDVGGADAVAVSVEPAGGSAQPTTDPILSVPLA